LPSSRKFLASTLLFTGLSIGGGIAVNNLILNPAQSNVSTNPTGSSTSSSNSKVVKTGTGDAIQYQYGVIQLKVTTTGGKITAIEHIQAGANNGREAAFPYLKKDAIAANGSSFSNLSGATFTTDAYKQALDSALSKLG